jgi:flagellar hook-length control protein FliK
MIPESTNILDQLLGGFETKPFGQGGSSRVANQGGLSEQLFGDVLGQMLLGGNTLVDFGSPQIIESLFPPNDQPVAQDGAPAGPTVDASLLMETAPLVVGTMLSALPDDAEPQSLSQTDLCPDAKPENMRLPFADLPVNRLEFAQSILSNEMLLKPAIYDVLGSRVEGGQLELTLAPQGEAANQIRISLPLSVLAQAVSEQTGQSTAVPTGSMSQSTSDWLLCDKMLEMDGLFKALNLKTLEVRESMPLTTDKVAQSPIELTLIGENQGARIAITARINKQDVLLKAVKNFSGNQVLAGAETETFPEHGAVGEASSEQKPDDYQMLFKKPLSDSGPSLTKNLLSDARPFTFDANLSSADGLDKSAPRAGSMDSATMPSPVKLTLPDTITKSFFSQGQTIMIRIEPDHLGPARLNLTVHDQMLTARVTVDTPMAKLAVENSLNQLTDQLSRAGIQVDRIDVMLSDGGTRHQFYDQRPFWSQSRRMHQLNNDDRMQSDALSVPITMLPPRQYVGAQGVNLLV